MSDDNDDILFVDLDGEDDEDDHGDDADRDTGGRLEISFDDEEAESSPPPAPAPRRSSAPDEDTQTNDEGQRYCPRCGYAIPPLADECPRCAREVQSTASPEAPQERELPPVRPATRSRRPVGLIITAVIVIAAVIAIPIALFNSPTFKARAAYREALKAQVEGDLPTAREKYQEALEHDPEMGLAAFGLGTTYLGITLNQQGTSQQLSNLLEQASAGDTRVLRQADSYFDEAIRLANEMPEDRKLIDQNLRTPRKLASYAHAFKGLTALIRYYAAIETGAFDVAEQWRARVSAEAQQAFTLDPSNAFADQLGDQLGF